MKLKPLGILLIILATFIAPATAAVSVQAKLDSVNLLMGKSTMLHLTVTQPKGVKGVFPLLSGVGQSGVIPVCGDSVELRTPVRIDSMEQGNSLKITYDVPVQSFDSGFYRLPEFVFVAGNDSARSRSVVLKVYPVNAKADDSINDYASTADPDGKSIFDFIPDWMIDFWWVILIVIIATVLFIYAMKRYRRDGYILPQKPQQTPYEAAISGLNALREQKLWEKGMEREYYTDLTGILRRYLSGRFGINAMEMTSREILAAMKKNDEIKEKRPQIRQALDMADFVKFAKVRPLPDDNVKAFDNIHDFVKSTKPVPVDTDANQQLKKGGAK